MYSRLRTTIYALFIAGLTAFTMSANAQHYWVGGASSWHNPMAWSDAPQGAPGAGIPGAQDDVIFTSDANISLTSEAICRSFIIDQNAAVSLTGSAELTVHGNLQGNADDAIATSTLKLASGLHLIDFNAPLETDIQWLEGAHVRLMAPLSAPDHTVNLANGGLDAGGFSVVCGSFFAAEAADADLRGAILYVSEALNAHPQMIANQDAPVVWPNENATLSPGPLWVNTERTNTCGTGPGQTPFTINATVATDFNGQDISCNGAEDGQATVSVVGGVGPFAFQWIGGNSPGFLQTYSGLGAGTYTVLVTDVGQGITCVDNVQLTEPAPLTVFDFTFTPPSCDGVCDGSGTPIVIGGVPGYNFNWGNGETTQTATALCEGLTTLEITDQNGCLFDTSFTVELVPIIADVTTLDVLCNGGASGEASVNPSGGSGGPYTVNWSTGDNGTAISGLTAGNYTVTITDNGGCAYDTTFAITEQPPITIALDDSVDPSCFGATDGAIAITINGGTPPFTTDWTGPGAFTSADEDPTGLGAGDYTVFVTDDNGCTANLPVTLNQPDEITVDADVTDIDCFGDLSGAIDITVNDAQAPFTTDWTGPDGFTSASEDLTGLEAGSYDLTVTDAGGCTVQFTYTVSEPSQLDINSFITDVSCNGAGDGAIDVNPSGGTPPYTFAWTGPGAFASATEDIAGLDPGFYDLVVTDDQGCVNPFTFEVLEPDPLDISTDLTPISCNGADDAAIDITVSGGAEPYGFNWTGPGGFASSDEDLTGLEPGTYDLIVTDASGCPQAASVVIAEPDPINLVITPSDVSCGGLSDGEIELTILGGTPPYTVGWTGPGGFTSSDEDLTNLEAGDYTVLITDVAGCTATQTVTVDEVPELVLNLDVTLISCNGANDGAIDMTIVGGQGPFTIDWGGPGGLTSNDEDLNGLSAGFYNVIVVDANGCFDEASTEITEPATLDADLIVVQPTCSDDDNGAITLNLSGGVEPYTVNWDNGDTGTSLSGLAAGTYTATVTDGAGCVTVLPPATLDPPPTVDINLTATELLCNGDADASIETEISGGTAPYTTDWTGPDGFSSTDEDLTGLGAGDYTITVTDVDGCTNTASITIDEPQPLDAQVVVSAAICSDDPIDIDLTISGGTAPYTIDWVGPAGFTSNSEDLTDVAQGAYDLQIVDDNGCVFVGNYNATAPNPLQLATDVTPLDCTGDPIGAVDLTITGGTAPYTINWTGPGGFSSAAEDISNLDAGTYDVEVIDDNGCISNASVEIAPIDPIVVDATVTEPNCNGENTGAIDALISGGAEPYNIVWSGPGGFNSTSASIANLVAGTYVIDVQDADGCTTQQSIEVTEPEAIQLDAAITDVICGGAPTGAIDLTVTGGTAPYDFVWTSTGFSTDSEDLVNRPAGNYQIDLQDANGCTASAVFTIAETPAADVELTVTNSTCGNANGAADAVVTGGTPPLMTGFLDEDLNPIGAGTSITDLPAGNYFFGVQDANGCVLSVPFSISDSDAMQLDAATTDPLCFGNTNGAIDLTITGGAEPITITWSGPDGFASNTEDISDLAAGSYTAEAVDANGCIAALTVDLTEPQELLLEGTVTDVTCGATDNGAIDATITGGTEPLTIEWTGPDGFTANTEDLSNLEPGDYTLTVTDANLCQAELILTVSEQTTVDAEFVLTDIDCADEATGSISTNVLSGQAPYTFAWTGPGGFSSANSDIAFLEAGTYNLVLTDDLGCVLDTNLTLAENTPIDLTVDQVAPNCGADDGSLEAIATGGTVAVDYTYFWYDLDNGNALIGNTAQVTGLGAGSYFIEVFDDLGCLVSQTVTLSENVGSLEAAISNPLCNGDANGTIDLTVNGFNPPYTYSWTGPGGFTSAAEDIADLSAGTYTVEVTDALGCLLIEAFDLTEPEELTVNATAGDVLCANQNNGVAQAIIAGGTEPYTIAWTGPDGYTSADQNIADLAPGCYQVVVTDANGCSANAEACIDAPAAITLDAIPTNIACFGDNTGSIEITATGGAGGFTYEWTGPNEFSSTDEDIFNLTSGGYTVTVTDLNMCTFDSLIVLSQSPEILSNVDTTFISCADAADGALTLNPSGGIAPYDVSWSQDGTEIATTTAITDLAAGTYTYTITDAFGCMVTGDVELTAPEPLDAGAEFIPITCAGEDDGEITVTPTGGTEPYSTFWIGPNSFSSTATTITGLEPGSYEFTLGDANGCVQVFTFDLIEPEPLDVDLDLVTPASCLSSSDGAIDIDISGGTAPYEPTWTDENGSTYPVEDLVDIPSGTYDLTVIDANGCTLTLNDVPVLFSGDVTADAGVDQSDCFGSAIELIGTNTGGDGEGWQTTDGINLSDNGSYTVLEEPGVYTFVYFATDNACIDTDTVTVEVFGLPTADAGPDQEIYFEEQAQLGGVPTTEEGNLVVWTPDDLLITADSYNPTTVEMTADQWFYLEVIDVNGCSAVDSAFISIVPLVDVVSGFTPNGDGMNEFWEIGNADFYPSLTVEVYNRWGELLYRSEGGYGRPWDGNYNGNPLPIGTYYYVITIDEPEYKTTLTGPVTILR